SGVAVVTICPGYVRTAMTASNRYRMPFIIDADEAARRFARAIAGKRRFTVIPWQMALASFVLRRLPRWLFDRLFARAPRKARGRRVRSRADRHATARAARQPGSVPADRRDIRAGGPSRSAVRGIRSSLRGAAIGGAQLSAGSRSLPDLERSVDDGVARHLRFADARARKMGNRPGGLRRSLPEDRAQQRRTGRRPGRAAVERTVPLPRGACLRAARRIVHAGEEHRSHRRRDDRLVWQPRHRGLAVSQAIPREPRSRRRIIPAQAGTLT